MKRGTLSEAVLVVAMWSVLASTWTSALATEREFAPLPVGVPTGTWVENQGQWPEEVRYLGQTAGRIVRLECNAIGVQTLDSSGSGMRYARITLGEPATAATPVGTHPIDATFSFFLGNDPATWRGAVPAFTEVSYPGIAPGVDLVLRSEGGEIVYDLDRSQHAPPSEPAVHLAVAGSSFGSAAPAVPLSVAWALLFGPTLSPTRPSSGGGLVPPSTITAGFDLPPPSLLWATYLGGPDVQGGGDRATTLAWNDAGELVVAGIADTALFPHTSGSFRDVTHPHGIVFVAKFRGRDGALIYSALCGGASTINGTQVLDVVLDPQGRATVVGTTTAHDFPVTAAALDTVAAPGSEPGFITQLDSNGASLVYSTYLESEGTGAVVTAVEVHPRGGIVVAGGAGPGIFPTTPGAFQTVSRSPEVDSFVGWLNASGSAFHWLSLLGGSRGQAARDVAVTREGRPVVLSWARSTDFPVTPGAFQTTLGILLTRVVAVTVFEPDGSTLAWSTFLRGNTPGEEDQPWNVALDADNNVYVAGMTNTAAFPVTPGAFQTVFPPPDGSNMYAGFVTRLDASGSSLVYSTLITGTLGGGASRVHVDASGVATLNGRGFGSFPTTPGSYDPTPNASFDTSLVRLSPYGDRLYYLAYVGGATSDVGYVGMNSRGRVAIAGSTQGGYPTTTGAVQEHYGGGQTDAFVTVLDPVFDGIQQFGESTASCRGSLQLNTTAMPSAGATSFALWCSGAPPSARGMLVFGAARSTPASVGGAQCWIDLGQSTVRIPVHADGHGFVETALPIPPGASGRRTAAQCFFQSTPNCANGVAVCSSNALRIQVR